MGRRPNAIVSEHFSRGEKLTDASNRYSHTCKRCGEVFPKGRVDSLMSHLVKRCPSITQDDRHTIYQAIQHQDSDAYRRSQNAEPLPDVSANKLVDYTQGLDPSFWPTRDEQRLRTLAEVSKLASGDEPERPSVNHIVQGIPNGAADDEFAAQLDIDPFTPHTGGSVPQAAVLHVSHDQAQVSQAAVSASLAPSPLIQAAEAANEELQHFGTRFQGANGRESEKFVGPEPLLHPSQTNGGNETISWGPTNASNIQAFGNMTATMRMDEASTDLSFSQRTSKNRARGRFTDTRRKEVQQMRKKGACMRCRMLKKPCSDGTPCSTCKGVESARLWKGACLRTRLADEFTLWSTGLYHSKAKIELPGAVRGLARQRCPGRVEVRLFSQSDLAMTLPVSKFTSALVKCTAITDDNPRPQSKERDKDLTPGGLSTPDVWLLDEGEGTSAKIEEYVNQVVDACVSEEKSAFLRSALQRAQEMVRQEQANGLADLQAHAGRSSYTLQNELLKQTVELWVQTVIIALRTPAELEARYNPKEAPTGQPIEVQRTDETSDRYTSLPLKSRELIFAQLRAATEWRCVSLAKTIMTELERRLLQRGQVSRFATVISSVILLNCIERMSGLYRTFDPDQSPSSTRSRGEATLAEDNRTRHLQTETTTPSRYPDWPLDESPRKLWPQGEHFADLLIMLLQTRKLPPQTTTTADGRLIASQDHPQVMTINRSVKEQTDDQTRLPAAWLDHLGLKESELIRLRDDPMPSGEQGVRTWDMKFICRLLLPESSR